MCERVPFLILTFTRVCGGCKPLDLLVSHDVRLGSNGRTGSEALEQPSQRPPVDESVSTASSAVSGLYLVSDTEHGRPKRWPPDCGRLVAIVLLSMSRDSAGAVFGLAHSPIPTAR